MELLDYRDRFPILESTTYLINHSLGAMPAEAERRLQQFAHEWKTRGARAWGEGWWDTPVRVGDLVGSIVGAPPGTTVMHQNVTVAEAIVLSCFDLKPPRNRIVFEAGLFPSVRYVQQAWERFGAEVVVCEDADAVIDAIDECTLLVPVSHVLYKSAEIQPIERIVARAHELGAHVCLDAYQSAGAVPLDVTELGIAFCVGGSVKWLCGGPGAGWLYVRPDLAETLEPAFAGWQAHARPFAFEEEMEYAPGATRFLTGTPVVAAN
jgi:kynureninase